MVLYMVFKFVIPLFRGEKKGEHAAPNDDKQIRFLELHNQLCQLAEALQEMKAQIAEIRNDLRERSKALDERITGLWSGYRNLREACAATHGRTPGSRQSPK
jgi:predicted  nucleic acid-binding Zn-ribbon protein